MERPTCREVEKMPIQSKVNFMRSPLLRMGAVLILAAFGLAGQAIAQEPAAHDKIYVVTHVDIVPPDTAADSRKDKGVVQIEASAQISRVNHISIVEVWQNQKAFDEHVAAAHTRQFRQQIDPMLGSPYDERLHLLLE
jgi:quinol monooxygenase YgiN